MDIWWRFVNHSERKHSVSVNTLRVKNEQYSLSRLSSVSLSHSLTLYGRGTLLRKQKLVSSMPMLASYSISCVMV